MNPFGLQKLNSGKISSFLALVFLLLAEVMLDAQILAPQASYAGTTQYSVFPYQDPIYVFYSPQGGTYPQLKLSAQCPGGGNDCNFIWYKYRFATGQFDSVVKTETNINQSEITAVAGGGYRLVRQHAPDPDTVCRAWVFVHDIVADALETNEGKVPDTKFTCDYVELNGTVRTDTLVYADPQSGALLKYTLKPTIYWSSVNEEETVENAFSGTYVRNYNPPPFDTRYILKVTDASGILRSDTVLYKSIQTRADFSFLVKDAQDSEFRQASQDGESAPLVVQFINKSVNGKSFTWKFLDTVFRGQTRPLPLVTSDTAIKPEFTYYIPHRYTVRLISVSEAGCVDSTVNSEPLVIKPSLLEVPNFFTPDIPGGNSRFIILRDRQKNQESFASIRSFHITIYSRWGAKVYEYEGDINDWDGWNGTVRGSGRPAAEGYYYYVIEAKGYDDVRYQGVKKTDDGGKIYYTGFLYLFRQAF